MRRAGSFVTSVLGEGGLPVPSSERSSLPRSASVPAFEGLTSSSGSFSSSTRPLERQVRALQRQVGAITDRLWAFEEQNAQWGLRYTRRFALAGNLVVGGWIFLRRLLAFLRRRRAQLLQAMIPKIQLQLRASAPVSLGPLAWGACLHALKGGSWFFFFCAVLLTRNRAWNRLSGATLATAYAAYLSLSGVAANWPWAVVFSVCGNLSYLVANFNSQAQADLPSFQTGSSEPGDSD